MTPLEPARDVATAVLAERLGHLGEAHLPAAPLRTDPWDQLVRFASVERIEGHLARAAHDGLLPVTEGQLTQLDELHAEAVTTNLRLEQVLLDSLELLEFEGITAIVLKGSAVAHLDYADPAVRSFGDVDLLVRPVDVEATIRALQRVGYVRQHPEPRPGFDRRFGKGATLVSRSGWEVDVHRTLAMGPFGLSIDLDQLWRSPSRFELGGRDVAALASPLRAVHACYHAALGNVRPRLVALADIVQITQRNALDGSELRAIVDAWGGEVVLARAVRLVHEAFGVDVAELHGWASTFQPTARDRRALGAYAEGSVYAARALAGLRAVRGVTGKAAYVRALVLPERRYVRDRYEGRAARWRRGLRRLLGARRDRRG